MATVAKQAQPDRPMRARRRSKAASLVARAAKLRIPPTCTSQATELAVGTLTRTVLGPLLENHGRQKSAVKKYRYRRNETVP